MERRDHERLHKKHITCNHDAEGVSRRGFLQTLVTLGTGVTAMLTGPENTSASTTNRALKFHKTSLAASTAHTQPILRAGLQGEAHVHLNQVGYLPQEPKRAVVPSNAPIYGNAFCLIDDDSTPRIRYQGTLSEYQGKPEEKYGRFAHHYFADFDAFQTPGRYRMRLSDGRVSVPFSIGNDLYARLIPLTLEYFSMQRCGEAATDLHGHCHRDDGIINGGPRHGQVLSGHGGWHDAGDYMKFVETTSYVTALMLFTGEHFPHLVRSHGLNNAEPELLIHARVGLEWLLRMHPTPDEFYYQIGDEKDHDSWRLPEDDNPDVNRNWRPRTVHWGVGANLAGRCAAAFAKASRLYARYDQAFAHRCLEAAQSVYKLGLQNPMVVTTNPHDFYPEATWEDDMEWGAVALYKATHDPMYLTQALDFAHRAGAAHEETSVYNTHALAHYELYSLVDREERVRLRDYLRTDAELARQRVANPYGLAVPYSWGTSETATGAALNCLLYSLVAQTSEVGVYQEVARRQRDFVLGCNPFNLSYLIGAGTHYPLFPHHQVANIRQIELTGAIVGGPADFHTFSSQNILLNAPGFETMTPNPPTPDDVPDQVAVYHDSVQDYVTNEPAIDYTAKFLLLAAFYHPHSAHII